MSAVPGTFEVTYKVPRRRHPVLAFALQQPLGTAGLAVIVLMLVAAAFAKWVAPYDPLAVDYGGILAPPSWSILSARTTSAATCSRASSTARRRRWRSASCRR